MELQKDCYTGPMDQEFTQTGGIRYGSSFWLSSNYTIPFANLRLCREGIILSVSVFGLWRRTFDFPRQAIRQLRWKRVLFSPGLQIEHTVAECPPFVVFWVTNRKALAESLSGFGYEMAAW